MRVFINLLVGLLLFSSCKKKETVEISEKVSPVVIKKKPSILSEDFVGNYVGLFKVSDYNKVKVGGTYTNKINISVDKIIKDSIFGHSVVAGNSRPFKGVFDNVKQFAHVREPGDNKYDGTFDFIFNKSKNNISGTWKSYNTNLKVSERKYTLEKRTYKYSPKLNIISHTDSDFNIPIYESQEEEGGQIESVDPKLIFENNASVKELTNEDLENLNKGELQIIRNLIYARHGYSFKNRRMRYFFDSNIDWYIPVSTDVRNEITPLEIKNIALIKRYEEHPIRSHA